MSEENTFEILKETFSKLNRFTANQAEEMLELALEILKNQKLSRRNPENIKIVLDLMLQSNMTINNLLNALPPENTGGCCQNTSQIKLREE